VVENQKRDSDWLCEKMAKRSRESSSYYRHIGSSVFSAMFGVPEYSSGSPGDTTKVPKRCRKECDLLTDKDFDACLNMILCGDHDCWKATKQRAAKETNHLAQAVAAIVMGSMHLDSSVSKKNFRTATEYGNRCFSWLKGEATSNENRSAVYCWAQFYMDGIITNKDTREGEKLLRRAAELGCPMAHYQLGIREELGSADGNCEVATNHFVAAAETGCAMAEYKLAQCCEYGQGIEQDMQEATRLYRQSSQQGYVAAQCSLARCYEDGDGIDRDMIEAVRLYQLAATNGNAQAICNLGHIHERYKDLLSAYKCYRQASEMGYPPAHYHLALCYQYGRGADINNGKAARLLQIAVSAGVEQAQCSLATYLYHGIYLNRDYIEAANLLTLCYERGELEAGKELGHLYLWGHGVPRDLSHAVELLRRR
jgi:TPR repeat protein